MLWVICTEAADTEVKLKGQARFWIQKEHGSLYLRHL